MSAPAQVAKLKGGYYNSANVSGSNPGGLANNGHEVNFPAALVDLATVAEWVGTTGQTVETARADAAASKAAAATSAAQAASTASTTAATVTAAGAADREAAAASRAAAETAAAEAAESATDAGEAATRAESAAAAVTQVLEGGPVASVNGHTGAVTLDAADVGAVSTVNGKGGAVTLDATDVGAVSSVNGKGGAVTLKAADLADFGTATGVSVAGSNAGYEVLSTGGSIVTADGGRTFVNQLATGYKGGRSGVGRSSGKWYFEVRVAAGTTLQGFGVMTAADTTLNSGVGQFAGSWGLVNTGTDGFYAGSSTVVATVPAFPVAVGDVFGVAVDLDTGRFWAARNGAWLVGDPAAGTGPGLTGVAGTVYPASSTYASSSSAPSHTLRLTAAEFSYAPPAGFAPWVGELVFAGKAATAAALAAGGADRAKLDAAASRAWLVKSAAYTAAAGDKVAANTATVSWVLTLPTAPAAGAVVDIMDAGGAFASNPLTVARAGQTIMGLAENLLIDVNNVSLALVFNGATWRIA